MRVAHAILRGDGVGARKLEHRQDQVLLRAADRAPDLLVGDGLHLLPPDQLAQSQQLQSETKEFLEKTKAFNEIVADFITVMEGKSKVIEAEKLKAIGLGNRVTSEAEVRKRKQLEVQGLIAEKKAELDRLSAQHDSLMMVETAQRKMIDNLTNNEA